MLHVKFNPVDLVRTAVDREWRNVPILSTGAGRWWYGAGLGSSASSTGAGRWWYGAGVGSSASSTGAGRWWYMALAWAPLPPLQVPVGGGIWRWPGLLCLLYRCGRWWYGAGLGSSASSTGAGRWWYMALAWAPLPPLQVPVGGGIWRWRGLLCLLYRCR